MTKRNRILTSLLLGFTVGRAAIGQTDAPPRNFVFILADDLGCRDLSGEGSKFYESPHIDSIAEDGMRFKMGYATCQVCSPSRASIMTGKFPARIGITDWIGAKSGLEWLRNGRILPTDYQHHLPHEDTTIAEALRRAGYATFFAGKWHLGSHGSLPEDHGFEINRGGFQAGSPRGGYFSPFKNPNLENRKDGELLPMRLARETVSFIETHREQPFLAFLSFYSVHAPIQTTEALWNKYRAKQRAGPTGSDEVVERFVIDRTLPVRQVQDNPIYAGMIESMDDAVGLVLAALKKDGLEDNTVVIFTSDNGGVSSGDAYATSNLPFRGGKGRQWEGGIREPYYIKAPGITTPGSTCDTPVTGTDFFPTILDLAGLHALPDQHVDGTSLVPLLEGRSIADRPLFWHYPHYGNQGGDPSSIVRSGRWKLIHYWEDGHKELYDLETDPFEESDVAESRIDRAAILWNELETWLGEVHASLPKADTRFDEARHTARQIEIEKKLKPRLEQQHALYLDPDWQPDATWWGSQTTAD